KCFAQRARELTCARWSRLRIARETTKEDVVGGCELGPERRGRRDARTVELARQDTIVVTPRRREREDGVSGGCKPVHIGARRRVAACDHLRRREPRRTGGVDELAVASRDAHVDE